MTLFIYYLGVFVILILFAAGDQKRVRIRTDGTPCISIDDRIIIDFNPLQPNADFSMH
jgi:hypothetical protein